jgi:Flp pilus assembly pilin Flp
MQHLLLLSHRLRTDEKGQDAIEYALIVGVFSLLVVSVFPELMDIASRRLNGVTSLLTTVAAR